MDQPIVTSVVAGAEKVDRIALVRTGMHVYDSAGKMVGKVDGMHGGGTDLPPAQTQVLAAPAPVAGQPAVPVVEVVASPASKVPVVDDVFDRDDDIPKELAERLAHDGFIRIDAGFLKHHRYALRDQIDGVLGDRVTLNVPAGELFKH